MAKLRAQYVCQECGRASIRPLGRCPSCGGWDTMVEEVIMLSKEKQSKNLFSSTKNKPLKLDEITNESEERWLLSMTEFARVLGGGVVPGSIVLLGGDPGIGKSTLIP